MWPSLSGLLQTHLVVPLRELEGVAPSGSVTIVGEMLVEELYWELPRGVLSEIYR